MRTLEHASGASAAGVAHMSACMHAAQLDGGEGVSALHVIVLHAG
jgi:hypothetical protein